MVTERTGAERITADLAPTSPLRLDEAVRVAFPRGGMTVAGLRRERDAGRLTVMRIAGKEFVTLAAIEAMLEACRCPAAPKVRNSGSGKGRGRKRSGVSATAPTSSAQAAALATVQALKESLARTSQRSMNPPGANVVSVTFPSRT